MSTRLLVWNLQGFTLNKIAAQQNNVGTMAIGSKIKLFQYSKQRLKYILSNVKKYNPNIFAVVEVISGQGERGSLVSSSGKSGCLKLLKKLRKQNPNWYLVPPLKLVNKVQTDEKEGYASLVNERCYTEGIAVFFREDEMEFIGPYIWPADEPNDDPDKKAVPEDEEKEGGPYPDEWDGVLPKDNYYAGQYEFLNPEGLPMYFPAINSRNPFMVRFMERGGNERTITLILVHLPPNSTSSQAFGNLLTYIENYKIQEREIVLVAGDFNLNRSGDYTMFAVEDAKLRALFNNDSIPNTTMNLSARFATPTRYLKPDELLDNILCRVGDPELLEKMDAEIADRVAEDSLLMTPMNEILAIADEDKQEKIFRGFLNFGYLGPAPGTSDHLAIYGQM